MNKPDKSNRRAVNERREDELITAKDLIDRIDRRRMPERRLSNIYVEELNISEEDFSEHFTPLNKKNT